MLGILTKLQSFGELLIGSDKIGRKLRTWVIGGDRSYERRQSLLNSLKLRINDFIHDVGVGSVVPASEDESWR